MTLSGRDSGQGPAPLLGISPKKPQWPERLFMALPVRAREDRSFRVGLPGPLRAGQVFVELFAFGEKLWERQLGRSSGGQALPLTLPN